MNQNFTPNIVPDVLKNEYAVRSEKEKMNMRCGRKGKRSVKHEDFPGGHPSKYYSRPSTLNFGVLMGFGALVLV